LGPTVIYFIKVGEIEIRAQQEAAEAYSAGRILDEGDACGIDFFALRWYDKNGIEKEA